jgi:hypothetical protein
MRRKRNSWLRDGPPQGQIQEAWGDPDVQGDAALFFKASFAIPPTGNGPHINAFRKA